MLTTPGRRYLGIDLAWAAGSDTRPANETGLVLLDQDGRILHASWPRGLDAVVDVIDRIRAPGDLIAIDAPLVVHNPTGMRACEREVARRYMYPWRVGANPSNTAKRDLVGVALRGLLEQRGVPYLDGSTPAGADGGMFECYPYTTIVGTPELGYDVRPRYKRMPRHGDRTEARRVRAEACDDLVARLDKLGAASGIPLDLGSHDATAGLLSPAPSVDRPYKHREDLLDAVICAWTAAALDREPSRFQVLGAYSEPDALGRTATILAPAKAEQRR